MQLLVLGLNHKTAPVKIRERFNFSNDKVAELLQKMRSLDFISEAMLLSTCNRTELYLVLDDPQTAAPFIRKTLKDFAHNS